MKKTGLLIIALILLLAGCQQTAPAASPTPSQSPAIISEPSKNIVVLSYPSSDLTKINRVTYEAAMSSDFSIVLAVTALLDGANSGENYIPFNLSASVDVITVSRNVAKIDISGDFLELSDKEFFCSVVSLVNTVTEIEEIEYVKLKINGEDFKPLGVFTNPLVHQNEDLYLLYLKHADYLENGNPDSEEQDSKNLLYFTDLSGKFLLAEVREINKSGEDLATDLITQLKNGPSASNEMKSSIPRSVVLQSTPQVHEDALYGTVLTISLEAPKHEAIDADARYMIAASIVSTMQSNLPEIDAVRVLINSQPAISQTIMRESDFDSSIGNIVTLYFPNESMTYLIPVGRALSQQEYKSPISLVREIIKGLKTNETQSAVNIFSSAVTSDSLVSVTVSNDIAYVNFSSDIYSVCQNSSSSEAMIIYSIVNTLTELKSIKRVQFLVDSTQVDTICGDITISEPLLPNPGITQK